MKLEDLIIIMVFTPLMTQIIHLLIQMKNIQFLKIMKELNLKWLMLRVMILLVK